MGEAGEVERERDFENDSKIFCFIFSVVCASLGGSGWFFTGHFPPLPHWLVPATVVWLFIHGNGVGGEGRMDDDLPLAVKLTKRLLLTTFDKMTRGFFFFLLIEVVFGHKR